MDELCGKRFGRRLRFAAVGLDSLLYALPELGVRNLELIAHDVTPDARPGGGPVDRVGDPGPEDTAVAEAEFIGDVVSALPRNKYVKYCTYLTYSSRLRTRHGSIKGSLLHQLQQGTFATIDSIAHH